MPADCTALAKRCAYLCCLMHFSAPRRIGLARLVQAQHAGVACKGPQMQAKARLWPASAGPAAASRPQPAQRAARSAARHARRWPCRTRQAPPQRRRPRPPHPRTPHAPRCGSAAHGSPARQHAVAHFAKLRDCDWGSVRMRDPQQLLEPVLQSIFSHRNACSPWWHWFRLKSHVGADEALGCLLHPWTLGSPDMTG